MKRTPKSLLAVGLVGATFAGCLSDKETSPSPEKLESKSCGKEAYKDAASDFADNGSFEAETISGIGESVVAKVTSLEPYGYEDIQVTRFIQDPIIFRCGKKIVYVAGAKSNSSLYGHKAKGVKTYGSEQEFTPINDQGNSIDIKPSRTLEFQRDCNFPENYDPQELDSICGPPGLVDQQGRHVGVMP